MNAYLLIILALTISNILLLLFLRQKQENKDWDVLKTSLEALRSLATQAEQNTRTDFVHSRSEQADQAARLRKELSDYLEKFTESSSVQFRQFSKAQQENLEALSLVVSERLTAIAEKVEQNYREIDRAQKEHQEAVGKSVGIAIQGYKDQMRELFDAFRQNQEGHNALQREKLSEIRGTLERSVHSMQEGNEKKLEEMRRTVDEKLEQTLQTRLNQSFNLVNERLENVHKGLGEMQQLAVGVGDLKKVLSNVKTRGMLGERQLANLLEQMLAPEQYEVNCITRPGTNNRVEFALRIPQQNSEQRTLLMPVDSKFPIEDYYTLLHAHEQGDATAAEAAARGLENALKKAARDICEKYLSPPHTTDVGILFLPIEGLYAEAIRRPALMEYLQREYQVILAGPTTFSAILHTITFGYRTMALEQRSGEIKKTLSAVKTEFGKFGEVLRKAQERIHKAGEDIEELVGTRTKKINARLRSFESLNEEDSAGLLDSVREDT